MNTSSNGPVILRLSTALPLVLAAVFSAGESIAQRPESSWVTTAPDGSLQYTTEADGDRIPDFSTAGYRGGLERIPTAEVKVTVNPGPGDDYLRIQSAISEVARMPMGPDGLRGAVLLTRGQYEVAQTLRLWADGVVLRGEGQYGNGTVLTATGTTQRPALQIVGRDTSSNRDPVSGSTVNIADARVPVGATSFNVAPGHNFAPGDNVIVNRGSTQAWFEDIGVDHLEQPWKPGTKDLRFDRTITAVNGNTITVDAPIVNALEQAQYGEMTVYKYTFSDRLRNVGVENLRFVSETDGTPDDNDHAWSAVEIGGVEDAWVRQVDAKNFGYAAINVRQTAKAVTVEDVSNLEPVSSLSGGHRYPFALDGSETLVQRVFSEDGRHDFVLGSTAPGPNVFLFATAVGANSDTGPHHRWSAGTLFDNVHVTGNDITARWRGNSGSGHGWAGANMVIWNSVADGFFVHNPPTAQNWVIGATGGSVQVGTWRINEFNGTVELGNVDSAGTPVAPNSLYIAQLNERFNASQTIGDHARPVPVRHEAQVAGDIDGFANDGASDNFSVDTDFLFGAQEISSHALGTFDSTQGNRMLAFTFDYDLASTEQVLGASLVLGLKVLDSTWYANDVLHLDNHAARFHLTDTLDVPTGLQAGDQYNLVLNLADLFGPLLSPMQDGKFSVFLSDDHAIDFAALALEISLGDFDTNRLLESGDLEQLYDVVAAGTNDADFDLHNPADGLVNADDLHLWIDQLFGSAPGDLDLDGDVDADDLDVLAGNWQQAVTAYADGDINGSGFVDIADLGTLASNWLFGVEGSAMSFDLALASSGLPTVPEPSGLALLVAGGLVAVRRRRAG